MCRLTLFKIFSKKVTIKPQNKRCIIGESQLTITSPILVKTITICPSKITMTVGSHFRLKIKVYPQNANNKRIRWSSDNSNIAEIDPYSSRVYGKNVGTTYIQATAMDGSGIYEICKVTVNAAPVSKIILPLKNT